MGRISDRKLKFLGILGIIILAIVILNIISHFITTPDKISRMSYEELSEYITDNVDDISSDNVQNAILRLNESSDGLSYKILIEIMKKHPSDPILNDLYESHKSKFIGCLDLVDATAFRKIVVDNLNLPSNAEVEDMLESFTNKVNVYILKNNPRLLQKYKAALLDEKYSLEDLKRGIGILCELKVIDDNKKDVIINSLNAKDSIRSFTSEKESCQSELNEIDEEISETLGDKKQIFTLSGYMIQKESYNTYEVQPDHISSRAVLMTTNTAFQSRGWFSILVKKGGTTPVTLKEDYGGFTQDWPIYIEASSGELEGLNSKLLELRNKRNETLNKIDECIQKIQVQESKLTKMNISLIKELFN